MKQDISAFFETLAILNNPSFQNIKKWKSAKLSEYQEIEKNISGLYAIWNEVHGFIYIGKAKSIRDRIRSHFNATQGKEKAESWKQFFEYFNKGLVAFWYPITNSRKDIGEQMRQALERIIQIKYEPLFDKIYPKGNHKTVGDIGNKIKNIKHAST